MKKKLILRLANGLGNQLFLYATAYSFSKKMGYELEIDDKSGFIKDNRNIKCELNNFNISSKIVLDKFKFDTNFKKLKRFILKKKDNFTNKKSFLIEKRDHNKKTKYSAHYLNTRYKSIVFMEGYFQSEKYFHDFKKDILKEFDFKKNIKDSNLPLQEKIINNNSIALHIRHHAFSETYLKKKDLKNIEKSQKFRFNTIEYSKMAVKFFQEKTPDPIFFIFSNDFENLKKIFVGQNFIFVDNNINNDPAYDLYLMHLCKHFIVSPSTFSWWGAWLSSNTSKICISPPENLIYSNNSDITPQGWIHI